MHQQNTRLPDANYYCYLKAQLKPATVSTMVSYAVVKTFLFFSVPLAIMCTLYTIIYQKLWNRKVIGNNLQQSNAINKRVTKAMVAIVINFTVCWLPTEICTYLGFIYGYSLRSMPLVRVFSFWLWNANSAINPWLYSFFNKALRLQHLNLLTDITTFFSSRRVKVSDNIQVIALETRTE
jgi:hypothetical protein